MRTLLQYKRHVMVALLVMLIWTAEGQQFWEATTGPYGVSLWESLVTTKGTYYGGAGDGRVFRRRAGETLWRVVLTGTGTILTLYEHNGTLYAGDADGMLMQSTDDGESWEDIANGIANAPQVRRLIVNAKGELVAGTSEGIYKRNKGGWELKPFQTQYGMFIFSLSLGKDGTLWAGSGRGLYRSSDDGETWTLAGFAENANALHSMEANADGDIYLGTSEQGLYVEYADDGKENHWVPIGNTAMQNMQARKVSIIDGTKVFVSITGNGIYYSENDTDWVRVLEQDNRAGVDYDPVTDRIVAGTTSGFWSSPNVAPFNFEKFGLPLDVSKFYTYKSKLVAMTSSNTRMYESTDQGATWSLAFSNSEGHLTSYGERDNQDRFYGCWGGFNGSPWVQAYIYIDLLGARDWWSIGFPESVTSINDILVSSEDSVYVGTDNGFYYIDTKTYIPFRLSKVGAAATEILSLKEDRVGNLYALTDDGLYVSTDKGKTWGNHLFDGEVVNAVSWGAGEALYVATQTGLYHLASLSSDAILMDHLWDAETEVRDIVRDVHGHLYATAGKEVYYAEDETHKWEIHLDGTGEGYKYNKLVELDNAVYLSTSVGIYKHTFAQKATVTLNGTGNYIYNGTERAASATTNPAGLSVTLLYNGRPEVPKDGGSYRVTAAIEEEGYAGQAQGRITIEKAEATVTISGLGKRNYNGNATGVTATTVPAGLPVVITYNEKTDEPTDIGEYYVVATIDHASYKGYASGDMIIQDAILGTESPLEKMISLSPVPARDQVVITHEQGTITSIAVLDAMGRSLDQKEFQTPVRSHTLSVSQYPEGLVLFRITTDTSEKIVKRGVILKH